MELGVYVTVFKKILLRSMRVLPLLLLVGLGFLFSFRLTSRIAVTNHSDSKQFNASLSLSMVRFFTMILGDYNNNEMGLGDEVTLSTLATYTLYLSCIFIVVLLLVNMFQGISVDELSNLIDESHNHNVKLRCEYVLGIQHVLTEFKFKRLLESWLIKEKLCETRRPNVTKRKQPQPQQQQNNMNPNLSNSSKKSHNPRRIQSNEPFEEILEKINIMDDKINYTQAKLSEKISNLDACLREVLEKINNLEKKK